MFNSISQKCNNLAQEIQRYPEGSQLPKKASIPNSVIGTLDIQGRQYHALSSLKGHTCHSGQMPKGVLSVVALAEAKPVLREKVTTLQEGSEAICKNALQDLGDARD